MTSLFAKSWKCLALTVRLPQTLWSATTEVLLRHFDRRGCLKFILLLFSCFFPEFILVGKFILNIIECSWMKDTFMLYRFTKILRLTRFTSFISLIGLEWYHCSLGLGWFHCSLGLEWFHYSLGLGWYHCSFGLGWFHWSLGLGWFHCRAKLHWWRRRNMRQGRSGQWGETGSKSWRSCLDFNRSGIFSKLSLFSMFSMFSLFSVFSCGQPLVKYLSTTVDPISFSLSLLIEILSFIFFAMKWKSTSMIFEREPVHGVEESITSAVALMNFPSGPLVLLPTL